MQPFGADRKTPLNFIAFVVRHADEGRGRKN
jgi:hypothetical protein